MDEFLFSLTLTGTRDIINDPKRRSHSSLPISSYTKTNLYCEYQSSLFSDSKKQDFFFVFNFSTSCYAFIFLMLIANAVIFYVSNHWAGTRKKLSEKVFILSTMKTRYYCLI